MYDLDFGVYQTHILNKNKQNIIYLAVKLTEI